MIRSLPFAHLAFAASLALLSASAQAGLFDDDEARKAILDLRAKVEAQNREIVAKQNELTAKQTELTQRTDQLEQATRGLLQLQNQLQILRDELARLRGQVEVQSNEVSTLASSFAKTDKARQEQLAATEAALKRIEPVSVQLDGKTFTADVNEKRRFDAAMNQVRAGDFRLALTNLAQFQVAYPESGYATSVNYWIGASHYGLKDYRAAITSFQSLIAAQPAHARTPDAYFNLAAAQVESGDRRGGRRTLEILIERFPDAAITASARERLPTIRP